MAWAELLERDGELRLLETLVAQAADGDGRVGLIEGPPGIGKTTLITAARQLAAQAGMRGLSARGSPMERAFPFGVVRQLFESVLAADAGEHHEIFAGPAARVERLLSGEGEAAADGGGAFALYHGLYWLTANLSAAGSLALLVDDLHWCDSPSLAALEYLGRRLEGLPVLLVLASRAHEPGFDRSVLDALSREPAAREVSPRALSEAATAELVRARLSPAATDGFCRACHAASGGNPLLVAELSSALAAEGVTGQAEDVARVAEIGPEAVARAVRLRLARLSDEAQSLARAASVLGDGAPLEDAAALSRLDLPEAAAAATALAEADLLRPHETVAFVHPVVRAAVYARLGPFERRDAHARAVRLLAEAGRPAERIAAQVLRCPPAADSEAVGILRAAARRSMADGAARLAADYLLRALEEPPPAGQRPQVLSELGTAERPLDSPRAAGHLREALTLTEDPAQRAQIALGLGRALLGARRMGEAKTVLEEALADPSVDPAKMRSLETSLVVLGLYEPHLVPLARERLSRFDPGAPLTDLDSRILLAFAAYDQARTGTGKEVVTEQALRLVGDQVILAEDSHRAFAAVAGALLAADRLDEAQHLADDLTRAGAESGSVLLASSGVWLQANVLWRRGALADAEAYFSSAVDTAAAHGFITVSGWAGAQYATVLADRGDGQAAWEVLRRLGLDGPLADTVHLYEARLAAGLTRVERGQVREGIDELRAVGRRWEAIGVRNPDLAPWRPRLAQALLLLGEHDEARALAEEHAALARAWGAPRPLARALLVQGLTLGGEPGISLLRESVAVARASPGRLELALSLVELGAAERRANRRTGARELLEEGLALAHQCGARSLQDRALTELLAADARPRRPPASGRDTLTPSELRIADLAAVGQTNRQIAQRLFITQKTVEAHLARAFRKLHVDSRAQLPAALSRETGPGRAAGTPIQARQPRSLPLSPVRRVVRGKNPVGVVIAVRRGGYPQRLEQFVEVNPDHGRERAIPADIPGRGKLRLRGQAARLRPAGLDAVVSVEHVGDHGRGRHVLADGNGRRDVFGHVDHQPGIRAVGELVGDPPSAGPPGGLAGRVGDDRVAESIDRARPAEVDAHVDALGNQVTDGPQRVAVAGRARGRLPGFAVFSHAAGDGDADADNLGLLAGIDARRGLLADGTRAVGSGRRQADRISLVRPRRVVCPCRLVRRGEPGADQQSRARHGTGRGPDRPATPRRLDRRRPDRRRPDRRRLAVPGSRAGVGGCRRRRLTVPGGRAGHDRASGRARRTRTAVTRVLAWHAPPPRARRCCAGSRRRRRDQTPTRVLLVHQAAPQARSAGPKLRNR